MPPLQEEIKPCSPSPCGANAVCKERDGVGSCSCLPEYFGDPYTGCRPECVQNSECDRSKACINNKCKDPCPGVCGINASKFSFDTKLANEMTSILTKTLFSLCYLCFFIKVCVVQNHAPFCYCNSGYTGDPATVCNPFEISK